MRLTLLLLLAIPLTGIGQAYTDFTNKATKLIEQTVVDYPAVAALYDSAFAVGKPRGIDLYNAACTHARMGHSQKAVQFLQRAFEVGYNEFDWMYYDRDLNSIRRDPAYLAFEKKHRPDSVVFFFDILRMLHGSDDVNICNKRISIHERIFEYSMPEIMDRSGLDLKLTLDSLIDFSGKVLTFCDSRFDDRNESYNSVERMALKELDIDRCTGAVALENIRVEKLFLDGNDERPNHLKEVMFDHVTVNGIARIEANGSQFLILNSTFNINVEGNDKYRWGFVSNLDYNYIEMINTTFNSAQVNGPLYPLNFDFEDSKNLRITDCKFNYETRMEGTIGEILRIRKNSFPKYVDINALKLPDFSCYIPFSQFQNSRLVWFDFQNNGYQIHGDSAKDYSDEMLFDNLTGVYKRLYDHYRDRADIESANRAYVLMKDLEIAHLQSFEERNLEQTMRLRLNQLMGFYTDHATSPGKALIISFYIILGFGIFYCFFPSDWDKTSKSQIIADFKRFIEKNEHGYVRPFFKMMKGLFISLLNATALSMNAFITLGFGNIPTTGIARYMCIIQGALGWFLLSLFTVALLNQVLL